MASAAYSPGHITGFFFHPPETQNPEERGSLGAGFSLELGARSQVIADFHGTGPREVEITINGQKGDFFVSRILLELFEKKLLIPMEHFHLETTIELPQGGGFGTSGAGVLSQALAINDFLGRPLSSEEAGMLAHLSELEAGTGLGTVLGEYHPGMEIRIQAGGPGIGKVQGFEAPGEWEVLAISQGSWSTKETLANPNLKARIGQEGQKAWEALQKDPRIENFLNLSRSFVENTGLVPDELRPLLDFFDEKQWKASLLLFGKGVFTLLRSGEGKKYEKLCKEAFPGSTFILTPLAGEGGHLES
jgi:pantoate kinase